jgi:predicted alpha/beta hydrolase family esterase
LSRPAQRALTNAGYRRLEQLARLSEADVERLHGVGPKALAQLRHALIASGLSVTDATGPTSQEHMSRQVLFVHGGGEGAYEEDRKMAASLRDALGVGYEVQCPKMPDEDSPLYAAWRDRIASELAELDGEVFLVGHSLGASILLKYISEESTATPIAGTFLDAAPYWGVEDWEVDEWVPFATSRYMRNRFRRQDSASSMDADISSTMICQRLPMTSRVWRGADRKRDGARAAGGLGGAQGACGGRAWCRPRLLIVGGLRKGNEGLEGVRWALESLNYSDPSNDEQGPQQAG